MHYTFTSIGFIFLFCFGLSANGYAQTKMPKATLKQKSKKRKKRRMTPAQVDAHNAKLIADIDKNLPKRAFKWDSIVLHHTASEYSSVARIDAYHRKKFNDPDGIEYHFLIGNGKKAARGLIEFGRWPKQKRSIHLFKPKGYPASITISLVGNFHVRKLGPKQYKALRDLVVGLSKRYNIPHNRITTHTSIDGRLTVCPGKHFPKKRLLKDIGKLLKSKEKPATSKK